MIESTTASGMKLHILWNRLAGLGLVLSFQLGLILNGSSAGETLEASRRGMEPVREIQDRIARQFVAASPVADPGDARARDLAASRLAECRDFLTAVGDRLLWGGCEPVKGYDPKTYSLTEFDPIVWLKLYGSTLMFTGEHEVKTSGDFTILEMKARFRSNLDPGDYPYPFWHSSRKWQAYLDLTSLCLVFRGSRIVAVYRVSEADPNKPLVDKKWDGRWMWRDPEGNQQPRVALFNYIFGSDNPHRAGVDEAYRRLESRFRAHDCTSCHSPDNAGKSRALLLLNYPNQSLFARHSLVETLENRQMPPADHQKNLPSGIEDESSRAELVQLARVFAREADAAIAFEASRKPVARSGVR